MPLVAAAPLITGALGAGAAIFGTHKQSQAQSQARRDQQRANQQAMNYERNRARRAWDQYRKDYDAYYQRFGDKAVDRYGMPRGVTLPKPADPNAPPAAAPAPSGVMPSPVAPAPEVDAFRGEARSGFARGRGKRGGSTVGGLLGGGAGVKY